MMPRPSRRHEVYEYLRANPTEFTIRELCEALNMSYVTCRSHLNALTDSGEITKTTLKSGTRGKPSHAFQFMVAS